MNKTLFSSFLEWGKCGCYYYRASIVFYGYWEKKKWNESNVFASTTADIFSWVCASSFLIWSFVKHWEHLGQLAEAEAKTGTISKVLEMSRDGGCDGVLDWMFVLLRKCHLVWMPQLDKGTLGDTVQTRCAPVLWNWSSEWLRVIVVLRPFDVLL